MIRLLKIRDFRSINKISIDIEEVTAFVGSNDAGKSNILRALNLFFNGKTDHATDYDFNADYNVNAKKYNQRAQEIIIELGLKLPRSYRRVDTPDVVYWKKVWRAGGEHKGGEEIKLCNIKNGVFVEKKEIPDRSKIRSLLGNIYFHYIPAIKDKNFFIDLQGKIYDALSSGTDTNIHQSASGFESEIGSKFKDLLKSIDTAFNSSNTIVLPKNLRNIFEQLEFNSEKIPLSRRGDGIKIRHIPSMLRFIGEQSSNGYKSLIKPQIWGFEEPENNVEFTSCFLLNKEFLDAARNNVQIILTTHSPAIYPITEDASKIGSVKSARYYVSKSNESKCTELKAINAHEIHENIGFLPLIAPYIAEKESEWAQTNKIQSDLIRNFSSQLKNLKCSRIFVEGASDRILLKRAIKLYYPSIAEEIHVDADGNNSANAAADRAHAFFLVQKHESSSNQIRGMLLLDADDAGSRAKKVFEDSVANHSGTKYVKSIQLKKSPTIIKLKKLGVCAEADLESTYPIEIWEHALSNGWLLKKEKNSDKVTEVKLKRIFDDNENFQEFIDSFTGLEKLMIDYSFTLEGKVKVAKYIDRMSDEKIRELKIFEFIEPILVTIIEHFGKNELLSGNSPNSDGQNLLALS